LYIKIADTNVKKNLVTKKAKNQLDMHTIELEIPEI
jgi:hypothetical protein